MISPPKKLGKATARNKKTLAGKVNPPPTFKKKPTDSVFDAISSAKESIDKNVPNPHLAKHKSLNQPKNRFSKKTPSTSSGSSSNKGNEAMAQNYYNRMNIEHKNAIGYKPRSLKEERNKYKSEKCADPVTTSHEVFKLNQSSPHKENQVKQPMDDDIDFDSVS